MKTQTHADDESQDMKSVDDDISTASTSEHTQSSEADGSDQDLEVKWKMKVILGNR